MTREEAIEKMQMGDGDFAKAWLDRFVRLGMLKLDEPRSAEDRFQRALFDLGYSKTSMGFRDAMTAFEASQK